MAQLARPHLGSPLPLLSSPHAKGPSSSG
jgi:hypothetical protein